MKRILTFAAIAATLMCSATCSDTSVNDCVAYDISITLKTLTPKETSCKDACGPCGDAEAVSYLTDTTRKLKGIVWGCEYNCGDPMNIVLWDEKAKKAIIPYSDMQEIFITGDESCPVYGKKMNQVACSFEISYESNSNEVISVSLSGINGKIAKNNDTVYIKSMSGNCSGNIAYYPITKGGKVKSSGSLCDDPVDPEFDVLKVLGLSMCDCFCTTKWCEVETEVGPLAPCTGTWKLKYNKKMSLGSKSVSDIIPSYAH